MDCKTSICICLIYKNEVLVSPYMQNQVFAKKCLLDKTILFDYNAQIAARHDSIYNEEMV